MNNIEEKRMQDQKEKRKSQAIQCAAWKIVLFSHAFLAAYFAYLLFEYRIVSTFLLLLALAAVITAIVIKKPLIDFMEFLYPQPTLALEEKEMLRKKIKKYWPDQKTGP